MKAKLIALGTVAILAITSNLQAGDRERRIIKALLFPPVPVPIGNKVVDLNSVLRSGKVKSIDLPKPRISISVPKVQVRTKVKQTEKKPVVRSYFVTQSPPKCVRERRTCRPTRHHVWISGYWERYGCRWTWVDGYWAVQPSVGARWQPGQWVPTHCGWQWTEGYWQYPRKRVAIARGKRAVVVHSNRHSSHHRH